MNWKHENGKSENKKSILVVYGHSAVRQELVRVINRESNFVVCGEAENTNQALETIENRRVDLAIVDSSQEGTAGIQIAEEIRLQHPNLPVLTIPVPEFLNG